ncbi:hypothetical protein BGW80DRAFT_692440 [Lactifluus volemus]|nr:hypothetical protein BGW80DRAFT_692440 [Lactifluus volemus]
MPVLSLATSPIVSYDALTKCLAILAVYIIFVIFCYCTLVHHRRSSQSSTYSRETSRLISGYHPNTVPIIRVVAPESRPTSARTQSFPQPPPIYGRGAQPAVKTPVTTDHERNLYRSGSVLAPPGLESPVRHSHPLLVPKFPISGHQHPHAPRPQSELSLALTMVVFTITRLLPRHLMLEDPVK